MKNTIIFLILALSIIPLARADHLNGIQNKELTITASCIRNGQIIPTATATIEITDALANLIVPQTPMLSNGNGTLIFTYNFTNTGGYSAKETCDFGDFLADGSDGINIYPEATCTGNSQSLNFSEFNQTLSEINNNTNTIINTTNSNGNWLQQIWNYLTGYLNTTITNINTTTTNTNIIVNQIYNQTNTTLYPATINPTTTPCYAGSNWHITASVLDQNNNNYPSASCIINTTIPTTGTMTYNSNTSKYEYSMTCPAPTGWNYTINCV